MLRTALLLVLVAGCIGCDRGQDSSSETPPKAGEPAKPGPGSSGKKLPLRTAEPPDPAKEQYVRDKVFVKIEEKIHPRLGEPYVPEVPILQNYLSEYFRRAGFEVVQKAEEARYRIEGVFEGNFLEEYKVQGVTFAQEYEGKIRLSVKEAGKAEDLETLEIPDFHKSGGLNTGGEKEEKNLVIDLRRHLSKIVWENLYHVGKVFTDPEIPRLISSLAADDSEKEAPVQAEAVIRQLAARRLAAVPYLIEALTDERIVRVNARYPGLTQENAEKLRIYHLMDRALEEIFQKVSGMDLETPAGMKFRIIKGWENEWRKFCPAFRNSPEAPRTGEKAKG